MTGVMAIMTSVVVIVTVRVIVMTEAEAVRSVSETVRSVTDGTASLMLHVDHVLGINIFHGVMLREHSKETEAEAIFCFWSKPRIASSSSSALFLGPERDTVTQAPWRHSLHSDPDYTAAPTTQ